MKIEIVANDDIVHTCSFEAGACDTVIIGLDTHIRGVEKTRKGHRLAIPAEELFYGIKKFLDEELERKEMLGRDQAIHGNAAEDPRPYYQAEINKFRNEMGRIDHVSGTYAKLRYGDVRPSAMHVHGAQPKMMGYQREIEIDEIVLTGGSI